MNQIERLRGDLKKRFPEADLEIDPPATETGSWFLTYRRADALPIVIEWRPDRGFGVSTPEPYDYGSGVDELYPNAKATYDRVVRLVLSNGKTEPPLAVRLAELRQSLGISQVELAERVGVKQANISRIEARDDMRISTLYKVVAALGATLSIRAKLPDGTERELQLDLGA